MAFPHSISSADAGARIRGLPAATLPAIEGAFCYTNCLRRAYDTQQRHIRAVEFDISRYGKHSRRIDFEQHVSEADAIHAVEAFLSEPLTQEYYESIKSDTFHRASWEEAQRCFTCRGDALTDARFIEVVDVDKQGVLRFGIGS